MFTPRPTKQCMLHACITHHQTERQTHGHRKTQESGRRCLVHFQRTRKKTRSSRLRQDSKTRAGGKEENKTHRRSHTPSTAPNHKKSFSNLSLSLSMSLSLSVYVCLCVSLPLPSKSISPTSLPLLHNSLSVSLCLSAPRETKLPAPPGSCRRRWPRRRWPE